MAEIAQATAAKSHLVMNELLCRLDEDNWRHVYKALVVIEYVIKAGAEMMPLLFRRRLSSIAQLQFNHYVEDDNKEVGKSVREKAKQVVRLLTDQLLLEEERSRADRIKLRMNYPRPRHSGIFSNSERPVWAESSPAIVESCGELDEVDQNVIFPRSADEEDAHLHLAIAASIRDLHQADFNGGGLRRRQEITEKIPVVTSKGEVTTPQLGASKPHVPTAECFDLIDLSI